MRNVEGYNDPTVSGAFDRIDRDEQRRRAEEEEAQMRLTQCVRLMKQVAEIAGFRVADRIVLRDIKTGREFH